jgi:hypothetical protein
MRQAHAMVVIGFALSTLWGVWIMIDGLQPYQRNCQNTVIIDLQSNIETKHYNVAYTVNGKASTDEIFADDFYASYKAGAPAQACEYVGEWIEHKYTRIERVKQ